MEKVMSATPLKSMDVSAVTNNDDVAAALENIPPFQDLTEAVRRALSDSGVRRRYGAGQTVFSAGQYDGGEFFVVVSGKLKLAVIDAGTGAVLIEEFGPNSVFGLELAMSECEDEVIQQMAVTAESDLDLVALDACAFRNLASQRPSLMRNLALFFSRELAGLRFKTTTMQSAPEQKVFLALLEYIERDAVTGAWRINKMPKHRELADLAGVEESIAASAVASLIQENIAHREYPGLVIRDMNRLNQLAT